MITVVFYINIIWFIIDTVAMFAPLFLCMQGGGFHSLFILICERSELQNYPPGAAAADGFNNHEADLKSDLLK